MSPAGRPEIGQPINVRLGPALLAAIDGKANSIGISRAQVIRTILSDALASEMGDEIEDPDMGRLTYREINRLAPNSQCSGSARSMRL